MGVHELHVTSGFDDGMHVTYKTYIMTWEGLKKFIDYMAKIESEDL